MEHSQNLKLCYLDASKVKSPLGELAALKLESTGKRELGTLDGVLIDPAQRRVRYYVVDQSSWFRSRKYLIPTDCPASVEPQRNVLRLEVQPGDLTSYRDIRDSVRPWSDEDLVDALFARQVA